MFCCCFCLLCLAGQPSMAGLCSQSSASSQDICFVAIPSDANEVDVIVEVGWLLVRCCCPFMFQFYMFIPIFLLLLQLLFCGLSTLYYVDVLSIWLLLIFKARVCAYLLAWQLLLLLAWAGMAGWLAVWLPMPLTCVCTDCLTVRSFRVDWIRHNQNSQPVSQPNNKAIISVTIKSSNINSNTIFCCCCCSSKKVLMFSLHWW